MLCGARLLAQSVEHRIGWTDRDAQTSWPIRIVTASDGSRCVAWGNGCQLFTPAGDARGAASANTGSDGGVFALGNDRWAYMREKDSTWRDSEYAYNRVLRHFEVRDPWDLRAVSDTIYYSENYTNFEIPQFREGYGESPGRMTFAQTPQGLLTATVFGSSRQQGIYTYSNLSPRWTFLPTNADSYRYVGHGNDVTFPFRSANDQLLAATSPAGVPYLFERHRVDGNRELLQLHRLVDGTGAVETTTVLDTVPAAEGDDRIPVFVPHDDGAVDVLSLLSDTDTLTVRCYNSDGRFLDEKFICSKISFLSDFPDIAHTWLPGGRHLLTWSRVDDTTRTRLYIAVFDASWNMIGVPVRVSPAETEYQVASGLSVHGGSVAVAWLDSRPPYASVYLKEFPVQHFISPRPPVYEVLYTQIGDDIPAGSLDEPEAREEYERLRAALIIMGRRMHTWNIPWTVQSDWKFLLATLRYESGLIDDETKYKPLLEYLRDDLGVVIDPHSRERYGYNYTDVSYLLDSLGLGGSKVIGGHIWDPALPEFQLWDRFRLPVSGYAFPHASWRGEIMMGSATPMHASDPVVSGVWRPMGRWHYFIDDEMGNIACIGQYMGDIFGVRDLLDLRRRGIIHPDSILTSGFHITPAMILDPVAQGSVEDTVLRVLSGMRDDGDVVLTDFTSLIEIWREYFDTQPHLFRPGLTTGTEHVPAVPGDATLLPPCPNPVSSTTQLAFRLPRTTQVVITLHDVMGRCVRRLLSGAYAAGSHRQGVDVSSLPSGAYLLRMAAGRSVRTTGMVVRH
jgi:hypothetical protein